MKNLLKNKQFTKFLPLYFIILSIVILLGTSYSLLRSNVTSANPYTMNVGLLNVDFYGTTNTISIQNMAPMTDQDGLEQNDNILNFSVKNTGDLKAEYDIYIEETSSNPSFKSVIRYAVNKNDSGYGEVQSLDQNNMLYIDKDQSLDTTDNAVNYKVKIWISDTADNTYMNKTFSAKVVIVSRQYNKTTITFNANGGTVSPTYKEIENGVTTYGTLPTPTPPDGYIFAGWYTDPVNGTEVTSSTSYTQGISPTTLYAHYMAFGEDTTTFRPTYFGFDGVTTSSPTKLPENKKIFLGLDTDGNVGPCIIRGEYVHCFNTYTSNEVFSQQVLEVFSDIPVVSSPSEGTPGNRIVYMPSRGGVVIIDADLTYSVVSRRWQVGTDNCTFVNGGTHGGICCDNGKSAGFEYDSGTGITTFRCS